MTMVDQQAVAEYSIHCTYLERFQWCHFPQIESAALVVLIEGRVEESRNISPEFPSFAIVLCDTYSMLW